MSPKPKTKKVTKSERTSGSAKPKASGAKRGRKPKPRLDDDFDSEMENDSLAFSDLEQGCQGCGVQDVDLQPHAMTDEDAPSGEFWADTAEYLCEECLEATKYITEPDSFMAYAKEHGGR